MTVRVVYHSRGGNTEKLANAVANAVGVTAEKAAEVSITESVDLLFVGTAVYAGHVDRPLESFLGTLDPALVGRVAVFSSAAGNFNARDQIEGILEKAGVPVIEESFFCRGSFLFANRGRPNADDLAGAGAFAAALLKG